MPIATPEVYAAMLDAAKSRHFAYPAINVSSSQTLNAALQGFAEAELAHPGSGPVLFTVRPGRWLTFDFTEEDES